MINRVYNKSIPSQSMKFKLTLFVLSIGLLIATAPAVRAAETGTLKYTDGLKVGDKLEYTLTIDDNYDDKIDAKSGDKTTYELMEVYTDASAELDTFLFTTLSYNPTGMWKATYPNGTTEEGSDFDLVFPTSFEMDNGTTLGAADTIALATGLYSIGDTSEVDGVVKIHIVFFIVLDIEFDASTGILQKQVLEDSDGDGKITIELTKGGSANALPAYDLPVFIALAMTATSFALLRKRRSSQ